MEPFGFIHLCGFIPLFIAMPPIVFVIIILRSSKVDDAKELTSIMACSIGVGFLIAFMWFLLVPLMIIGIVSMLLYHKILCPLSKKVLPYIQYIQDRYQQWSD